MKRKAIFTCASVALMTGLPVRAVTPAEQYKVYLTRAQTITPVTDFGDQISLRDGKLSFKNVDVELLGNGPPIRITRTTTLDDGLGTEATSGNAMGEWELEIPRIKTVTSNAPATMRNKQISATSPVGWQVAAVDKNARCSSFASPAAVSYPAAAIEFHQMNWWFGYQLVDDQGNEHPLFRRTNEMPEQRFKLGTASNWVVECLSATANGQPGEAFLATSPDGTRYWFNYLTYTPYDGLSMEFENMPPKGYTLVYTLPRRAASMLVTRIEDRFGNWLTYQYDAGKLTSIVASDGRSVTIGSPGTAISSVTVGTGTTARTWSYRYGTSFVVTQPDGTNWRYTGDFGRKFFSSYNFENCSQSHGAEPNETRQVSVTTPSGAMATFNLQRRIFGRSYVPKYCVGGGGLMNPDAGYALIPRLWIGHAIASKVVTGPGVTPHGWTYNYSPHNGTWGENCVGNTCAASVWTDVTDSEAKRIRNYFSNRWDQTENKLLKVETYNGDGTLLSTQEYAYATTPSNAANPFPWPLKVGVLAGYNLNDEVVLRWTPMRRQTLTQDGVRFIHEVTAFDAWSRPVSVTKSSAPTQ